MCALSEGASPAKPQPLWPQLPTGGGGRRKKRDWNGGIGGGLQGHPRAKEEGNTGTRGRGNIYGQDAFIKEKGDIILLLFRKGFLIDEGSTNGELVIKVGGRGHKKGRKKRGKWMEGIVEIDYPCTNIAPKHTLLHRDVEICQSRVSPGSRRVNFRGRRG